MYRYVGDLPESERPILVSITEEQIEAIIDMGLATFNQYPDDPVFQFQREEVAEHLRRLLRPIKVHSQFSIEDYGHFIADRLVDATPLVGERVGSKAACMAIADIIQAVISEKRGGSQLNTSSTPLVVQYNELVERSKKRFYTAVWAYPRTSHHVYPPDVSDQQIQAIQDAVLHVSLSTVIETFSVLNYQNDNVPEWYATLGYEPPESFVYRIELNRIKCYNYSTTVHEVAEAIRKYMKNQKMEGEVVASLVTESIIEIAFPSLDDRASVSREGVKIIQDAANIHVKGIPGAAWVQTQQVSPYASITEVTKVHDQWFVYYAPVVLMSFNMKPSHLFRWLDKGGIAYRKYSNKQYFTMKDPPGPILSAWNENPASKETRFEIEYKGTDISTFYRHHLFDPERLVTNDFLGLQKMLGIGGVRHYWAIEFNTLVTNVIPNFDGRHTELIADTMTVTGDITSIGAKGAYQRGSEIFTLLSTKSPEETFLKHGAFGLGTSVNTAASTHFVGNEPGSRTGTNLWKASPNPYVGATASLVTAAQVDALKGNRIPQSTPVSAKPIAPSTSITVPGRIEPRSIPLASRPKISGITRLIRIPRKS